MNNTFRKIAYIISILVIALMLISFDFTLVYATNKSDLQNQQSELDQKINQTQTELAGIKSEMSTQLTQINRLNSHIS